MDQRFPREHRLKLQRDFNRVFDAGKRYHSRYFMLVVAPGPGLDHHRIGISVGRRVGNAVTRNRIKRTVREFYRTSKKYIAAPGISDGADMVVVARPGAGELDFHTMCRELEKCWQKLQSS